MERPSGAIYFPEERSGWRADFPGAAVPGPLPELLRPTVPILFGLLLAQASIFAWAAASGKIPPVVLVLFRALLTL